MKKKLSLYVHIPFCKSKCAYCDFLSFPGTTASYHINYTNAICNEIRMYKPFADRYKVETIYFGGGTPTYPDESIIEMIYNAIQSVFEVSEMAEITIEANPGTIKYTDMLAFKRYGFNRVSIGMQSADDECLRKLGRIHTFEEFLDGYEDVRRAGFQNVNVDVMTGIPGQTIHSMVDTLTRVTELSPEHISAYSLQVEDGTPLAEDEELLGELPGDAADRRMYAMTKQILGAAGYSRYEISNYAREGYRSRHNMVYWTGGEYIGFGLGSASYFRGERLTNTKDYQSYVDICSEISDAGYLTYEEVSRKLREETITMYVDNRMEEYMFLGLRMTAGVSKKEFKQRFGRDMLDIYGSVINKYVSGGFMEVTSDRVRLTDKGIDVSNVILADFLLTV